MPQLPIVHAPAYDAGFAPGHRFPMGKYTRLMDLIRETGLGVMADFHAPAPASAEWLALAHDRAYVDQVLACSVPALIEREIGFQVDQRVSLRARLATAGTVMAARLALSEGIACNTAGGSHHARRAQGAGFCTFNDVAVAAHLLLADGEVGRVLVIDLDVHQGDGTAEICAGIPAIRTVSMHSEKNYPARKQASSIDVALPDGVRDEAYLETLDWLLPRTLEGFSPDLVFYNAGVDPHEHDRLGRLSLSDQGLRDRDRTVFSFFRERGIPVASVLGGGYSHDIDAVARRHLITFEAALDFV
ncbi:MAG: histone deacetylase [Hoeflea sp.]|uniref:histone deacetylase family protein n=1 Tax=Hoeflea sp. TaxID=1940281 RepID=UPI001E0EE691|nr:histone deacetylase [Hoeflea sp.]MBU4531201.1 histone deacetylase [Alphaproteobacteria bacterium]MBU4545737.1 histone deacetylase [Alphaproteobacteria bacterium]MBU4550706.1 histone deacetylase [Alphaproteobacteria bacterium]MBV1724478.1 histone deacetylase [Hoeflea sp.]MBV1760498.1 histone deacetylase [Hoeflea sp.]